MPDDQQLKRYTERIVAEKAARDAANATALDESTLHAVAVELGLDPAVVKQAADDHRVRADGFRAHGRLDDAIAELEQACALSPLDDALRLALGEALAARFVARGSSDDGERARVIARHLLATNPRHTAAFTLLNTVDAPPPASARRPRAGGVVAGAGVVVGLAAALVAVVVTRSPAPATTPQTTTTQTTTPQTTTPPQASASDERGELDLAVDVVGAPAGLVVEVRRSVLKRYPPKAFYELQALVRSTRDTEIAQISWKLALASDDGTALATQVHDAPQKHQASVFSGDVAPLSMLVATTPDVRRVTLSLEHIVEEPARARPRSTPVALTWANKPADVDVVARVRSTSTRAAAFGLGPFFHGVWEFENKGTRAVRTLKVDLRGVDARGQPVSTGNPSFFYVVGNDAALRPGDVRLHRVTRQVGEAFDHATLHVLEVQ
jgi:hypothetical protein